MGKPTTTSSLPQWCAQGDLFIKDDRRVRPFKWPLGICSWLHDIEFTCPLLELLVKEVQGRTPVNAHGFGCPLEFLLTGFFFFLFTTVSISFFLLAASSGIFLLLLGLARGPPLLPRPFTPAPSWPLSLSSFSYSGFFFLTSCST